ncbi:unnamed protein product [Notodromas monacha]|uniref:Arf-GAP domain-containing protein n=1 Tax=Notodromas monacha TaxID=399045 RepID=A0A7R9GGK1_9CRUS|nr:unnamed protein product [Notodromas monacha]CAG0921798.1 unnamed protein product [Notodromas monacha]
MYSISRGQGKTTVTGVPLIMTGDFKSPVHSGSRSQTPDSPVPTKKKRRGNASTAPPRSSPSVPDLAPPPMPGYGDTIIASNPFDDTPSHPMQQQPPQQYPGPPPPQMMGGRMPGPMGGMGGPMGPMGGMMGPHPGMMGPSQCPPNCMSCPPDLHRPNYGGPGPMGPGMGMPNHIGPPPMGMGPKPMPVTSGKIYPPDQPMVFNPQNPNAPPIYPCGICHKEVHDNDQAILCESGCNFWFHRICTGLTEPAFHLLTAEVYAEWSAFVIDFVWLDLLKSLVLKSVIYAMLRTALNRKLKSEVPRYPISLDSEDEEELIASLPVVEGKSFAGDDGCGETDADFVIDDCPRVDDVEISNAVKVKTFASLKKGVKESTFSSCLQTLGISYLGRSEVLRRQSAEKLVNKCSVVTPEMSVQSMEPIAAAELPDAALRKKRKMSLVVFLKIEREKTKGSLWYDMPASEMTEERKRDLEVLRNVHLLDPKRFYKKPDLKNTLPKYFQFGKVLDNPLDFYSSRVPKKQRKRTIVEELLADPDFNRYRKRKMEEIHTRIKRKKTKAEKYAKRLRIRIAANDGESCVVAGFPSVLLVTMASSKRAVRQEDTNLTKLREIGARLENKTCFDCGQKGPTYVNTTIGSFVCTHCSGLLRGLTPPHRVKSISMASFTPEELDNLSKHGNHFCRGVWLGSYDEKLGYPDFKDEHKVRDFMIAKYEKKKYYVDPSIVERLEKTSPKSGAKPLASLVPQVSPLNVRGTNSTPSASAFDAWKTTPKSNADSGGVKPKFDPFGSLPNTPTHSAISQPNFADFDNNPVFQTAVFDFLCANPGCLGEPVTPDPSTNPFLDDFGLVPFGSKSGALQPMTSMSASSVCPPSAAGAATAAGIFGSPPIANTAASSNSTTAAAAATPPKKEAFGPDRYAALADLDELFKQTSVSPPEPPKPEPQTHAWMKPGGGFQQQHHHQQQPNGGFQQSNGVVHNPFQHPSGANSAGPAPAKSTNPFVANGGNAELVDNGAEADDGHHGSDNIKEQPVSVK